MEVYEFPSTPIGDDTEAGLLRTASGDDEKNCQCGDAAITPSNFYNLANYRIANTAYAVGDIVAVPYHTELQLKCTAAGTTSTEALDTTDVAEGDSITDGTVVWDVKLAGFDIVPVENGGTGASTADEALVNLGISGAITGLSISGKVITYTKKDGTTGTITTQDTNTSNWTISKGTNGYARDKTTGFTIQWGLKSGTNSNSEQQIGPFTFPKTFTTCYAVLVSTRNTDANNPASYDGMFQVRTWTASQFYVYQQIIGDDPWFSQFTWTAFGVS